MKTFSTGGTPKAAHRRGWTATNVAHSLEDASREDRSWRCRCPLHGGRSLTLRDGDGGRILVTRCGGCARLDVLAELRRLKLLYGRAADDWPIMAPRAYNSTRNAENTERAVSIWRAAQPIAGTPVERHLNKPRNHIQKSGRSVHSPRVMCCLLRAASDTSDQREDT